MQPLTPMPAAQAERVWCQMLSLAHGVPLSMPARVQQWTPRLTLEEVAILDELQREALADLTEHPSY